MRKKIVAGNWKMNKDLKEAITLSQEIVELVEAELQEDVTVILSPPFVHLKAVSDIAANHSKVFSSAQNCYEKASGAFTGEVAVSMIKSVGASYVIIGHSERRLYFNESSEQLAQKVDLILEARLTPIFCCGEQLEIREKDQHFEFVCNQITEGVFHLSAQQFSQLVIAYEPIWAIGTGVTASPEQAQEMHKKIREHLANQYGADIADSTTILYGGSCNPGNASDLFSCPDVDGGLIGGASLKARDFMDILNSY